MPLMAGSAKMDITPASPAHLAGYASRDHPHEGVHDPVSLRALYVQGPPGDALLVTSDLVGFPLTSMARLLPVLESELGLPPANVMCCATHTHSAPVVAGEHVNAEWLAALEARIVAAAALAKTRLQEVTLKVARGACDVGCNRREERPPEAVLLGEDQVVLGRNPEGPVDRELIVLALDSPGGEPVARVCSFGCHGTVMGPGNYRISGDWMGLAAIRIEESMPGAALLFLNGGSGDVDPRVRVQNEFGPTEEIAEEFRVAFEEACGNREPLPDDEALAGTSSVVHLPRKLRDVESGKGRTRPVRIHGLRLGPARIVGFPGEMFSQTALAVKEASPHPVTMVSSYNSGYYGGYVPVAEAYEKGGYEVRVSPYAEGAEAILREGLVALLAAGPAQ